MPASRRDHGPGPHPPDQRQLGQSRLDDFEPPAAIDRPTAFLMVGLPAAGKTLRAKELAAEHHALVLTPDTWMIPLFGQEYESEGWAASRDVLEGRLIALAIEALRLKVSVVLDFGLWGRDERSALRWLVSSAGASCQVVYLPVDRATQVRRVRRRLQDAPEQNFLMSEAQLDRWRAQFQVPEPAELAGIDDPSPPADYADWPAWAAERWPSAWPGTRVGSGAARASRVPECP
jgi:predicted kinase